MPFAVYRVPDIKTPSVMPQIDLDDWPIAMGQLALIFRNVREPLDESRQSVWRSV